MKKTILCCFVILASLVFGILAYTPFRNAFLKRPPSPTRWAGSMIPWYRVDAFGAPIQAGFSKKKITPPRFSWLGGRYPCRPALIVHDDLWVKALALKDEKGGSVIFVSVDTIGLLPDEIEKILSSVQKFDRSKIFISATHTHAGPDTLGLWGPGIGRIPFKTGKDDAYLDFLRQQVHRAIFEATVNLGSGAIRFSRGRIPRYIASRPNNPADEDFSVMQVLVKGEYGNNFPVTMVNVGAHPDILNSVYVSQDFPYYLETYLKVLMNGETMFVPRAIGGMELEDSSGRRPASLARKFGEELAASVYFSLVKYPIVPERAEITVKTLPICAAIENKNFLFAAKTGVISNFFENNTVVVPVSLITIGPARMVTVPGELFPNIWQCIEPLMEGRPNFCFGLTNGELGYILSAEDFNSGQHPYHVTMSIGPSFGRQVQETLKTLVSKKYKKRSF